MSIDMAQNVSLFAKQNENWFARYSMQPDQFTLMKQQFQDIRSKIALAQISAGKRPAAALPITLENQKTPTLTITPALETVKDHCS